VARQGVPMSKYLKIIIAQLLAVILSLPAHGQQSDIRKEIFEYKDSTEEMISNGRKLLGEKFAAGDFAKMKEIKDYLAKNATSDYLIFYSAEYAFILYWTGEYKELLYSITQQDSIFAAQKNKVKPQTGLLYSKLSSQAIVSKQRLLKAIDAAGLPETDRDILKLNLEFLVARTEAVHKTDSINHLADVFLARHPSSKYESYVRKYIRNKMEASKWGLGLEFFSGYSFFTDALADNYSISIPFGIAFDIQYKQYVLFLRDFIGFTATKKDIAYSTGIWPAHSQARVFLPEASFGYVVTENKTLKLSPFIGIASTDIAPTSYDIQANKSLNDADMGFVMTYTLGFNADIKLGTSRQKIVASHEQNYWYARIRYGFNMPRFERSYPGMSGNFHYITVGIGAFGRKIKRVP
jgi:hypothetical protein